MDSTLWAGLLAAGSALAGAWITQWGMLRASESQARQQSERDSQRREQEVQDRQTALIAQKRCEFLGFVLMTENRVQYYLVLLERKKGFPELVSEQPIFFARQAYGVALLYLADMQPLAKTFYELTVKLQGALAGSDEKKVIDVVVSWKKSFDEIEKSLTAR